MTLLGLLRALAASGAGLAPGLPGHLRWEARTQDKTPALREALRAHKTALLRLVDPPSLRERLHLPLEVSSIDPSLAVVWAWLAVEQGEFDASDRANWLDRLSRLIDTGYPRWFADLWATEEVVSERSQPTAEMPIGISPIRHRDAA
jgi:hypothetical protein